MPAKRQARKSAPASRRSKKGSRSAVESGGRAVNDKGLREHLLYLVRGGGAHVDFERAIGDLPVSLCGMRPTGLPFTAWRLLEHMRIAQWDILEFCRNPKHVSPKWPAGYWPEGDAPPDEAAWEKSVKAFRADLQVVENLVANPRTVLYEKIPHGTGQTILREALLVADHNAYHLGQIVMLRRLLGAWANE